MITGAEPQSLAGLGSASRRHPLLSPGPLAASGPIIKEARKVVGLRSSGGARELPGPSLSPRLLVSPWVKATSQEAPLRAGVARWQSPGRSNPSARRAPAQGHWEGELSVWQEGVGAMSPTLATHLLASNPSHALAGCVAVLLHASVASSVIQG